MKLEFNSIQLLTLDSILSSRISFIKRELQAAKTNWNDFLIDSYKYELSCAEDVFNTVREAMK